MKLYYPLMSWLYYMLPVCAFVYTFFLILSSYSRFSYLRNRSLTIIGWSAWAIAILQFLPLLMMAVTMPSVVLTPDWLWLFFCLLAMLVLLLRQRHLKLWKGILFVSLLVLLSFQQYIIHYWILPWFDKDMLPSYWSPVKFDWLSIFFISLLLILVIVSLHRRSRPDEQ